MVYTYICDYNYDFYAIASQNVRPVVSITNTMEKVLNSWPKEDNI